MNNNIRRLVIERWIDPLRDDPAELWPDFTEEPKDKHGILTFGNPDFEHDDLKEEMKKEEEERIKEDHKTSMKVLNSPHGVIPLTEFSFASRVFNFWTVHTNFAVTDEMIDAICDIDGIEDIMPISKHRFRISVGRLFEVLDTASEIKELLCTPSNLEIEADIYQRVKELKEKISCMEFWAIYVLPNGKMLHAASETKNEDFNQDLDKYTVAHENVGGILWTYELMEPSVG